MLCNARLGTRSDEAGPQRAHQHQHLKGQLKYKNMHRRLVIGAAAAFGAVFGGQAAANSTALSVANSTPDLTRTPVKLDRKNANLKLVQVVFRWVFHVAGVAGSIRGEKVPAQWSALMH